MYRLNEKVRNFSLQCSIIRSRGNNDITANTTKSETPEMRIEWKRLTAKKNFKPESPNKRNKNKQLATATSTSDLLCDISKVLIIHDKQTSKR